MSEELVCFPDRGRLFRHTARVQLADAAPDGRARLDALARLMQDAAYLDLLDAALDGGGTWILRRMRMDVERFPVFGEQLRLDTYCSGLGRMWAERRTTLRGDAGGHVEAVAIWVHLDAATGRPKPLDPEQVAVWETSAAGRRVKARLTHGDPPEGAHARAWTFRRADLDVAGHVNNAAYWTAVEETLAAAGPLTAEIEFRGGAGAGDAVLRHAGGAWWVCAADGEVLASMTVREGIPSTP